MARRASIRAGARVYAAPTLAGRPPGPVAAGVAASGLGNARARLPLGFFEGGCRPPPRASAAVTRAGVRGVHRARDRSGPQGALRGWRGIGARNRRRAV